eukprot:CAMPEP_0185020342 /NCGR_PEP_ID=MMETSP1103-20130426/2928_1 /TAXON_ID=36769 /ORGANISM="Paraphysomonas bandaiensis, Strain Caron Lab Isolate" /LENGTH=652 /DNA_ID=CAMNT_0027551173 /DNA_START=130 /DNA_END=2088 /DNA_ORIENTATION=+
MTELDSKSPSELLHIICNIIISIDTDMENLKAENTENKIQRIMQFLGVMKFIGEDQMENFHNFMLEGDKETMFSVMHWCLHRFEHLKKRAYLAKYLMPLEIPPEFQSEDLVYELSERLKEMQAEFKNVHKVADQNRSSGMKPAEYKAEIAQLEQERSQLSQKIQRLKRETETDEPYFKDMLKVTSALRKEQEEEARIHERLRESRNALHEADARFNDATRRLNDTKNQGIFSQSAEELLSKLSQEVKELNARKDAIDSSVAQRSAYLEKMQGWDNSDRAATEDDVRDKRAQLREIEEDIASIQERLDAALERNNNLAVFRQASMMAFTKLREKETEVEKLTEEKNKIVKQTEEKEAELEAQGKSGNRAPKRDLKKYGAQVREKIETYKRMREEISSLRAELVVLQRTEQILRSRDKNLDDFLRELERKKGVEGYRDTQRQLIEMSEKTAAVDQMKGATLEEISAFVEQIGREFKSKQIQLQPLMADLKALRQEYMEVETKHQEAKNNYDKVAITLDMDKQALEKECDAFQEECLREESRYHTLNCLVSMARIKLQRAEQEKKWNEGNGRMLRDFASFKELYAHKIAQQEQLTKQLRKQQKELKENAVVMTNQKSNFNNLQRLLSAKMKSLQGDNGDGPTVYLGSSNVMSMDN